MWANTAGVEVGVAGGGVNGVLFKVFADVLCGGLRQQPVHTLPEETTGQMRPQWLHTPERHTERRQTCGSINYG